MMYNSDRKRMRIKLVTSIIVILVFCAGPAVANTNNGCTNNGNPLNQSTGSTNVATSKYSVLSSLTSSISSSLTKLPSALRFPKGTTHTSNEKDSNNQSSDDKQKQHKVDKEMSKAIVTRKKSKSKSIRSLLPTTRPRMIKLPPYRLKWNHSLTSLFQFFTFQNLKYKEYIRTLKTQVIHLQRQIRLHQEEIKQLREKIQLQHKSKRSEFAFRILSRQKVEKSQKILIQKYELEIKNLKKQIKKMSSLHDELEVTLQAEQGKVSTLEMENQEYQKEIEQLHQRIEEMHTLQRDTLALVEKEREYFKQKIKEEQQKVEEERQKGLLAVEEEKIKMRKLVKALAMKKNQNKKTQ